MWHKNEYVMCRHKDGCALKRQQAHSPGQSEAAPREQHDCTHSPCRGKSSNYQIFTVSYCIYIYAFALAGRGDCQCMIPGVPLRSAPGYVLAAFSRRIHQGASILCQDNNVV